MGCFKYTNKNIEVVIDAGGDYIVPIKGNQGTFYQDLIDYFDEKRCEQIIAGNSQSEYLMYIEKSHSSIIKYECFQTSDVNWYSKKEDWKKLNSIGMVRKTITQKAVVYTEDKDLSNFYDNYKKSQYRCYDCDMYNFFKLYENKEDEFEKKFGFPMYIVNYSGDLDYNYEYLILDFYNYKNANLGYNIQELYGDLSRDIYDKVTGDYSIGKATGTSNYSYLIFQQYLKDRYNIDIKLNEKYLDSKINEDFVTENNFFDYDGILDAYNELKQITIV